MKCNLLDFKPSNLRIPNSVQKCGRYVAAAGEVISYADKATTLCDAGYKRTALAAHETIETNRNEVNQQVQIEGHFTSKNFVHFKEKPLPFSIKRYYHEIHPKTKIT